METDSIPKNRQNHIYTKNVWDDIRISEVNYILSDRTKRIIQKLTKQVACPTYKKTPTFKTSNKRKKNQSTYMSYKYSEVTKLENVKHIPQIRSLLNKITPTNLINVTDEIIMKLELIDDNGKKVVVDSIFAIASCNTFYSEQYAYIYVQIEKKYPYINTLLQDSFDNIIKNIQKGKDLDPNEDYDLYCEVNKLNDKNRAFFKFIIHIIILEKQQDLQKVLKRTLNKLIDIFCDNLNTPGYINICNEITELLFVSFVGYKEESIFDKEYIDSINARINNVITIDRKTCASYTSKAYFKLKDVLDVFNTTI